ncbi:MAG: hypothetical protein KAJ75_09875, partial [Alphaproteobacteria bacterium]|nr:hypothetical protein [Alphaproteobacteria bacterium]
METENKQKESVLENRLNAPLMRLRISLFDKISRKDFSHEDLDKFVADIISEIPDDKTKKEAIKAHSAVEMGRIAGSSMAIPEVNTPAQQLIWAANLAYLHLNPNAQDGWDKEYRGATVAKTPLWKKLLKSERVKMEKLRYALHLSSCVKNPEAKLRWGEPGSWFYNDPKANMVNLDLMQSMLLGFEHSRSVALHEVGHAELTVDFTPKMHEVHDRVTELQKVTKKRKLTKEEYKEYSLLSVEWKLRFQIFNAAEDNCVNRYAKVIGDKQYQDYGSSLNHMETILHRVGLKEEESTLGKIKGLAFKREEDSPEAKFQALSTAINLSFFKENGMFEGTDEDWKTLGVNPKKVAELGKDAGKSFDDLINACDSMPDKEESGILSKLSLKKSEPTSVAWLQPELTMTRRERAKGAHFYNKKVLELNAKRNDIIDEIYEDFAKDVVAEILKKYEKQLDDQLDNNQQGTESQSGDESREQEGQDGQEGAEGSSQGQGSSSMPVEGMEENQPDEGSDVSETPEEARKEEREQNQDEQDSSDGGEGSDSEDDKDSDDSSGGGGEGSDSEDEKDSDDSSGGGGEGSDSEDE